MTDKATLNIADKTVEFPVLKGTMGPDVFDIRKLYSWSDEDKLINN